LRISETHISYQSDNIIVKGFNVLSWGLLIRDFLRVEKEEADDEVNKSEGSKKGANEIQMRKWKVHFDKSKLYIKYMENHLYIYRVKK
jgi:hypothetical protein